MGVWGPREGPWGSGVPPEPPLVTPQSAPERAKRPSRIVAPSNTCQRNTPPPPACSPLLPSFPVLLCSCSPLSSPTTKTKDQANTTFNPTYDPTISQEPKPHPRPVLVSACLLGRTCRYDGNHNADPELLHRLALRGEQAVPFCPEESGGLATPRPAAWIESNDAEAVLNGTDRVITNTGTDVTAEFLQGAQLALAACQETGARHAYLKERSPSCGTCTTHVAGAPVEGPGITTALLRREGITVEGIEERRP